MALELKRRCPCRFQTVIFCGIMGHSTIRCPKRLLIGFRILKGAGENNVLLQLRNAWHMLWKFRDKGVLHCPALHRIYSETAECTNHTRSLKNILANSLRETCCLRTMIKRQWVPHHRLLDGNMCDTELHCLADIRIRVPIQMEEAVAEELML